VKHTLLFSNSTFQSHFIAPPPPTIEGEVIPYRSLVSTSFDSFVIDALKSVEMGDIMNDNGMGMLGVGVGAPLPPPLQNMPGMPTSACVGVGVGIGVGVGVGAGVGVGIGVKEETASDRLVALPIYKPAHLCNVLTSSHTQNALDVRGPKMKMKLFVPW
jgi:hypothetical protein